MPHDGSTPLVALSIGLRGPVLVVAARAFFFAVGGGLVSEGSAALGSSTAASILEPVCFRCLAGGCTMASSDEAGHTLRFCFFLGGGFTSAVASGSLGCTADGRAAEGAVGAAL